MKQRNCKYSRLLHNQHINVRQKLNYMILHKNRHAIVRIYCKQEKHHVMNMVPAPDNAVRNATPYMKLNLKIDC